jgi:hypothetical protein
VRETLSVCSSRLIGAAATCSAWSRKTSRLYIEVGADDGKTAQRHALEVVGHEADERLLEPGLPGMHPGNGLHAGGKLGSDS